jgi:tRNA dimethylallyltransferase
MKLWEKNFEINKEIERFTVGRDREMDLYLAKYDVLGSMAHITMLESIGLLEKDELTQLLAALKAKTGSVMHNKTDVDSCQRAIRAIEIESYNLEHPVPLRELPPVDSLIIGVNIDREARREKITRRLKARLEEGMVDEVRGLLDEGIPAEDLIYYGLEYKFVTEYVTGKTTYDEMFTRLEIAIHQFAKRQMTWFRGMERRGFTIHWIDALQPMEDKVGKILEIVNQQQ